MNEKPRYALRAGSAALTRRQWILLGSVLVVGLTLAIVLLAAVSGAAGSIVLGIVAVTIALIAAFGRRIP